MLKVVAAGVVVLASPLMALFGLVAVVGGVAAAHRPAAGQAIFNPSDVAVEDIPPHLLALYIDAAALCPGLPWQVVAAIGKIESDHGRHGGSSAGADGQVTPPIIGIPLNGEGGTARIPDTDDGVLDGDTVWDRAVGPFQFIPSSWAIYGQDGNQDSVRDPHNVLDAIPAAVAHLCPTGHVTDLEGAILSYNRSNNYLAEVLNLAARYTGPLASNGGVAEGYAYPLPSSHQSESAALRSHHDYPAIDFAAPVGTPIFAMVAGEVTAAISNAGIYGRDSQSRCGNTVKIDGVDGATYTYCHLSAVSVVPGQAVAAGEGLGLTGGRPGTHGAGNSTGPHLHLGIRAYGQSVCPQPVLLAILRRTPIPPTAAPPTGCFYPGPATDWSAWLDSAVAPATLRPGGSDQ